MSQDKTKTYDIVLIPDDEVATKAIAVSAQLAQAYRTRFTLDNQMAFPHYSIYMAELDSEGEQEARKCLQVIASMFPVFELEATKYFQDSGDGMFEVQYKRTQELINLQEQVLQKINPLRKGRFLTNYPSGATKEMMEKQLTENAFLQFKTYAYPEIGEDYRPHMTFTRLAEDALGEVININDLPKVSTFSGEYPTLALYIMGKNGTCCEEVARYELKAS